MKLPAFYISWWLRELIQQQQSKIVCECSGFFLSLKIETKPNVWYRPCEHATSTDRASPLLHL